MMSLCQATERTRRPLACFINEGLARPSAVVWVAGLLLLFAATHGVAATFAISLGGFSGEGALSRPCAAFYERSLAEFYVADAGHQRIAVYDSSGDFVSDIPLLSGGQGNTRLEPCAVAADPTGRVFVATNGEPAVRVYDIRGELLKTITSDEKSDPLPSPRVLFVDSHGQIHVLWHNARAPWTIYSPDLELAWSGGSVGDAPGDFKEPLALWVDAQDRAYVCDAIASPAVKVFGPDRGFLFGFGAHDVAREDLSLPSGIVTVSDGSIWVEDRLRQVIKQYDPQGNLLTMIGGWGTAPGELRYPAGLTVDGKGRLFVAENGGNRFQIYSVSADSASSASAGSAP